MSYDNRHNDPQYVPPQQLTPGGPMHGGFTFTEHIDPTMITTAVLQEVLNERRNQDEKWGEQNHPIHWPLDGDEGRAAYQAHADTWKLINAARVKWANERGAAPDRNCSWDGIAFEELYEAFAESDPAKIRAEAIQAAAVLVNMIECIDRGAR